MLACWLIPSQYSLSKYICQMWHQQSPDPHMVPGFVRSLANKVTGNLRVFWRARRAEPVLWGRRPSQTASPPRWTRRRGSCWAAAHHPAQTQTLDLWWCWPLRAADRKRLVLTGFSNPGLCVTLFGNSSWWQQRVTRNQKCFIYPEGNSVLVLF